jgi:hypothetical protein
LRLYELYNARIKNTGGHRVYPSFCRADCPASVERRNLMIRIKQKLVCVLALGLLMVPLAMPVIGVEAADHSDRAQFSLVGDKQTSPSQTIDAECGSSGSNGSCGGG